ncbi:hypothetical protein PR048_028257 [Dryococelus australis]|uniref:Uncharacterized protein n=1 Tax=Dryococelus australis TaxID=614101 RepID=A0ABQ9GIT6_9NEOP|nr:hypothetical protein PR048_028257 [Dryococelus australis]
MIPTMSKEKFLANPKNKGRLVSMMIDKFSSADITRKQSKEDPDTLIVNTTLSLAPSNVTVIVVGEDVDLLVILIDLCRAGNFFFLKPGKHTVSPATFSPTNAASSTVAENILFLHAMSGCDTTSANPHIADVVKVFKDSNATQEMVAAAGERFLVSLYGYSGTNVPSLNHLSCSTTALFLEYITEVQQWLGVEKMLKSGGERKQILALSLCSLYYPLLHLLWLCCSNMYLNCKGNCNNIAVVIQGEEEELDLETELEINCPPIEPVNPMGEE